jgi:hypothetical protein
VAERHDVNETPGERLDREAAHERAVDQKAARLAVSSREGWRRDVFIGFVLMFLLSVGVNFKGMIDRTEDLRDGCVRQGLRTEILYEKLARDGERDLMLRVEQAVGDAKLAPGKSVRVDCDAEYPFPWPLGVAR